ncbi:hypothetical protein IGI04_025106 [Brassica rapa subsp. trilocularis]|uniref:Uncharacterized protein n=1 Tax=Brassica rapa subsp. trilocularis TaxID=1813537 RepID=A0ABQ7MAQ2_BRACM|nr:hypothetical protein IGI04_025106 [Brassica rapa subsp. trilocularis]
MSNVVKQIEHKRIEVDGYSPYSTIYFDFNTDVEILQPENPVMSYEANASCISSVADDYECSTSADYSKHSEEVASSSSNKKTRFFSAGFRVKRRSSLKLENRTVVLNTRDSEHHPEHKRLKKWHKYQEGRYSSSSSMVKNENHFVGGFKCLKVKGLIRP